MVRPDRGGESLRAALVDLAFSHGKGGTLMNLMAIGGLAWMHALFSGRVLDPPWLLAILAVTAVRGATIFHVAGMPGRYATATKEAWFAWPLVAMSLLWALLPMRTFAVLGSDERLAMAVVFAGMAGGAATVLAPLNWPARLYLVCMLAPASLMLAQHERHGTVLGVLGIAYLVIILNAHRMARRMLIEGQLRFERNRQLSEKAEGERARAELLNAELLAAQGRLRDQNALLEHAVAERTAKMKLASVAIDNTAEGVMIIDPDGVVLEVNPAFTRITGLAPSEVIGGMASRLRTPQQDDAFYAAMWDEMRHSGSWKGELWSRRADGGIFLERRVINAVRDTEGRMTHYVAVFSDITESRQKDERIRHMAFHDALTGLPNRALLEDRIRHGIAMASRNREQMVVMFIDLDQFKSVNDGLGHHVGDLLLQQVAERIRGRLRSADTLARLGGDEFVVLLSGVADAGRCAALAQEILDALESPIEVFAHRIHVGASMGIASFPGDGADGETLMKNADTAMYAAKTAGRGTYRFFRPEMSESAQYRLELESELRNSLERGDFVLHYQPKVAARDGRVAGYEALLRWRHSRRGMVPPSEFIPVAEDSGLIGRIGAWTIDESCRQIAAWHAAGHGWKRIAVSLGAADDG